MKRHFLISRRRRLALIFSCVAVAILSIGMVGQYIIKNTLITKATDGLYTIIVSASTGGTASVTGPNGTSSEQSVFVIPGTQGSCLTINAVANTGYVFSHWQVVGGTGRIETASETYCPTEPGGFSATAYFVANTYTVTVQSADTTMGTVSPAGAVTNTVGYSFTVTANPKTGYHFIHWRDNKGGVYLDNPHIVTIRDDETLTAYFGKDTDPDPPTPGTNYTITATVASGQENMGTVSTNNCTNVPSGTTCTITASENAGFHFVQWSDGNTDNPRTITVSENATYTAEFAADEGGGDTPICYSVTASVASGQEEWGTTSVTGGNEGCADGKFLKGTTVTIKATANSGYKFKQWNNEVISDTIRIQNLLTDYNYVASFEEIDDGGGEIIHHYSVRAVSADENMGTVTGGNSYAAEGDDVTIKAIAKPGYEFVKWTNNINNKEITTEEYTEVVWRSITYTAHFKAKDGGDDEGATTYDVVTAIAEGQEAMGTVSEGGENIPKDSEITITATQADGYEFVKWTNNRNDTVITQAQYTFTVTQDITYTAHFKAADANTYSVTGEVADGQDDMGEVTGSDPAVIEGESATLTANPKKCYVFVGWTNNIDKDFFSSDEELEVTPTKDVIYTAHFKASDDEECKEDGEKTPDTGANTNTSKGSFETFIVPGAIIGVILLAVIIAKAKKSNHYVEE